MHKIDLHTHSTASPDGGITPEEYAEVLESNLLDAVAITDHNTTKLARELHTQYGDKIIVGEEIMTTEGEIIGLFLHKDIAPGQSATATCHAIKEQGGLVYLPHPFESVRKGIAEDTLEHFAEQIDIVEVQNGRALFQNRGPKAVTWAKLNRKPGASSSDAHGRKGLGSCYTEVAQLPSSTTLIELLRSARLHDARPPLMSLVLPKLNRLKKMRQK